MATTTSSCASPARSRWASAARDTAEQLRETLEEQGEQIVEGASEQLGGVDVTTTVRAGYPHEVILDYAETEGIDLIVMGTHGRTGLDRYLIGSVTEKVVRLSDVPVLSVREPEDG